MRDRDGHPDAKLEQAAADLMVLVILNFGDGGAAARSADHHRAGAAAPYQAFQALTGKGPQP